MTTPGGHGGIHVLVSGRVQGVGFRYFVKGAADANGVAGWVRNLRDGRVEAVLVGAAAAVQAVLEELGHGPPGSRVEDVVTRVALDDEAAAARRPLAVTATT
jgi:acylphosphatase